MFCPSSELPHLGSSDEGHNICYQVLALKINVEPSLKPSPHLLIFISGEESDSSSSSSGSESDIEKEEKISSVLFMQVILIIQKEDAFCEIYRLTV